VETVKPKKQRRYLRSRITRKLILDSATEIFIAEGYAKTTVEKISCKAGVGYGTVFSHYRGKNDILSNIVDRILYNFFDYQRKPDVIGDKEVVSNHYKELLTSLFQLLLEHRLILKVYHDATSESETVSAHWDSIIQRLIDDFSTSFKDYQEKGVMRDFDVRIGAKAFVLLVDSYLWEVVNEREDDIEVIANNVVDIMFQGLYVFGIIEIHKTAVKNT